MAKVLMRATDKMPERQARRMQYRTRMMAADIQGGGEFEVSSSDARILRKTGWAEDATDAPRAAATPNAEPKRRGRPPKVATSPRAPETPEPDLEDKTVSELREIAEARGVELPTGYIRKDELVERLSDTDDEDDGA